MDGIVPIFHSLHFHNLPRPVTESRLSKAEKLHSAKIMPLIKVLHRRHENPLLKRAVARSAFGIMSFSLNFHKDFIEVLLPDARVQTLCPAVFDLACKFRAKPGPPIADVLVS